MKPSDQSLNVSEFLQSTENIEIFWGFRICPENGMVERWNVGFPKDNSYFNFIVNPAGGGMINPTLHSHRIQYSSIPLFHHSNCERSELTCFTKR